MPVPVAPEDAGLSSSRLARIDESMQAFVDQGKVAGLATLVSRRGRVLHRRGYGKLNLATGQPVQDDSLFRLASLTKPITAVAMLMLLEQGRFDLHDRVSRWIPEFADLKVYQGAPGGQVELAELERPLTVRHLLTHTAGFAYGVEPNDPVAGRYREAGFFSSLFVLQASLPELIRRLARLPLVAQPGVGFRYSIAYDVLGYLIELIADRPFDVFLRERIFEPLGMVDTSFVVPPNKLNRFGPLYTHGDESELVVLDDPATSAWAQADTVRSGGGGLVSTLPDYFRFLSLLLNDGELDGVRLLARTTVAQMTTNQLPGAVRPDEGYGFGVGVQVEDQRPAGLPQGLFGWGGGTGPGAWVYPAAGLIIASMYQAFAYSAPAKRLRALALATLSD
jgi:CubicO group peptidase (beta-lactamase class C family)